MKKMYIIDKFLHMRYIKTNFLYSSSPFRTDLVYLQSFQDISFSGFESISLVSQGTPKALSLGMK